MRLYFATLFFLLASACQLGADATIFVYHRFDDTRHKSTSISTEKLRKDFQYLKENGYTVVPVSQLAALLKAKKPIPPKTVALTIDDNYKSFYTHGLPLFREFGYPFTLYAYTMATEKRYGDYMSWEELKEITRYGEVGLHSFGHPHLPYLSDQEITEDTQKASKLFEMRMGFRAKSYAYPYGEFDKRVKNLIKTEGFDFICNQNAGAVADFSDPYSIERIAVTEDTDIRGKLTTEALEVTAFEVAVENNRLTKAELTLADRSLKSVEIYLSGYGWERVKVNNAKVSYNTAKELKMDRNRVIVKAGSKIASKLIMKRK